MHGTESDSTDLRDYLRPLKARWWIVVIIALLAAVGTYRHYQHSRVTYTAQTNLYLQSSGGSSLDSILGTSNSVIPQRAANNEAILLQTEPVARIAAQKLGYRGNPRGLLGLISVTPSADSDFLNLTATASSAQDAIRVANAFAQAYVTSKTQSARQRASQAIKATQRQIAQLPPGTGSAADRGQLESQLNQLQTFVNLPTTDVQQVDPAVGAVADRKSPKKQAIFALAVGALLGLALVYGFEFFDRRVKRMEDLPHLYGRPVLVGVPRASRAERRTPIGNGLVPPFREAFRGLRTALQLKATATTDINGRPLTSLLVASAVPGEGKSTVVRNLALAYHEAGLRVMVIDADLRRPQVASSFGVDPPPEIGLTEVLSGEVAVEDAVIEIPVALESTAQMVRVRETASFEGREPSVAPHRAIEAAPRAHPEAPPPPPPPGHASSATAVMDNGRSQIEPRLSIMPAGTTPKDPAAVLTAGAFSTVLSHLRRTHDVLVIDSSPLLAVSDGAPLLSEVDGVLLVGRIGLTTTSAVRHLNELLRRVNNVNVLGVVANDLRNSEASYGAGYGYGARRRSRLPWRR
jgi:Mrp family chromosome partitioning ATPase/capsular polysaccharide biosynthesis protein